MEFRFKYRVKASDIWQVRMYYAYASYLAAVNLTCIAASIVLIITQWGSAGNVFKAIMLIFLSLFLVIQPLGIYVSARSQAEKMKDELEILFNDYGVTVSTEGKQETIPWNKVAGVTKKPTLVILYTDPKHGYILTNRVLEGKRNELLTFIENKMSS